MTCEKYDIVQEGQNALQKYKETGELPNLGSLIKEDNHYNVLRCIFEEELAVWEYISLEEAKIQVSESLKSCEEEKSDSLIILTALLAYTCIDTYSVRQLNAGNFDNPQKKKEWENLFEKIQPQIINFWLKAFSWNELFFKELEENNRRFGSHNLNLNISP